MKKNTGERKKAGLKTYIAKHWKLITIFVAAFALLAFVSFINVATSRTIVTFNITDYEVGQISDRTITASKAIPEDEEFAFTIYKGETIIKKGFPISESGMQKLEKMATAPMYIDWRAFANSLLFFLLLATFSFFLYSKNVRGQETKIKEQIFLSIMFIIVYAITAFMAKIPLFSTAFMLPVIIPAAFVVILITVLFGQTSAISFSILLSLGVLYAAPVSVVPAVFVLSSSIAAVRIMRNIRHRMDMVSVSVVIGVLDAAFLFMLRIIFNDFENHDLLSLFGVAINGFLSGIIALGFLTPLETLLNTPSVFRLMDLSDLNNPIMRKMLLAAPGTYNHSLLVAQLAEAACDAIGANSLLARVGAYYHDIGKMDQPEYFAENQQGQNKHDDINPKMSVLVVRSHVKKGVEKAHMMHLPQEVIDIIDQHHGNSLIQFFYHAAKKQGVEVTPEEYSYMGNPPTSREAGIVMLADTVEAACRSLENPSVQRLEKFISKLVMKKYEDRQLDKSGLTFADIDEIQKSFVTILSGYYHSRVKYPNQTDPDEEVPTVHEK
ncbi:MAG TPA: HDIG domain-containing protein [Treponemataceae bacterium]|nr:HDIG domain-containing protein [Treponemataceae bacterium]